MSLPPLCSLGEVRLTRYHQSPWLLPSQSTFATTVYCYYTPLARSAIGFVLVFALGFVFEFVVPAGAAGGAVPKGGKLSGTAVMPPLGAGNIAAGFSTHNIAGLFISIGLVTGAGISAVYTVCNILPVQYFSGRLGLASGLVKLGGGIGGTTTTGNSQGGNGGGFGSGGNAYTGHSGNADGGGTYNVGTSNIMNTGTSPSE